MTDLDKKIIEFAEQIIRYGHAITIHSEKNGMQSSVQSTFTPIEELTNGVPFYEYLREVIDKLTTDRIIIITKQKNGFNAYKNPKTFILEISGISPHQNNNIAYNSHQVGGGLTGFQTQQNSDPMNQVLSFKIEQQNQQIQELKPFKEKYENEREKRFDLERELKLINEKHELEKTREHYESKNSVAGVLKELKEPITHALAGLAGMQQNAKFEGQNLGSITPNKTSFILDLLNEMDESIVNQLFEINTRLAFLPKVISPVLETIKKNTSSIDEQFNEVRSQF